MKRKKKHVRDVLLLTGAGVGSAVGAKVITGIGGPAAASATGGVTAFSGMLPPMGTIIGGKMVLDKMYDLTDIVKRKKRRR